MATPGGKGNKNLGNLDEDRRPKTNARNNHFYLYNRFIVCEVKCIHVKLLVKMLKIDGSNIDIIEQYL